MRAFITGTVVSMCLVVFTGGTAYAVPPHPDPNFLPSSITSNDPTGTLDSPCKLDNKDPYEKSIYETEGFGTQTNYTRYPGNCRRIHFAFGPIVVKPGQNDVLLEPITIDKPAEDGYVTYFKPNLVDQNGNVPPVEQVHLHHATWLNEASPYGNSAFFAAGEEKTIGPWPTGFGMPVKQTDTWQLLYMVHSAVSQPMSVWITYDVDFVPQANAEAVKLKPALPVWLDVRPSAYPVFNVQRKFGDSNGECTWPKQECAAFDPYGNTIEGQGQPGNGKGTDYTLPSAGANFGSTPFYGGTIIGLGGHLHPGGIRNEVDLVRGGPNGQSQRIYNGIPTYWDHTDQTKGGGPGTSWDFSMRVSGLPQYGIQVKPGDILRSNAVYDTKTLDSYEDMGIVVGLLVPNKPDGTSQAPGLDPYSVPVDNSDRCDSGGMLAATPTLCPNGYYETHGHYPENGNYSGPAPGATIDATDGQATTNVGIADFLYEPGDLSTLSTTGVPTVKLGSSLTFTNADSALDIYHTITTCKFPCLGDTGSAFPLADGETSFGRQLSLDSSELGYGVPTISGVKNDARWSIPVTASDGYKPGEVVTYYCRIHPSMRGAFKVVS